MFKRNKEVPLADGKIEISQENETLGLLYTYVLTIHCPTGPSWVIRDYLTLQCPEESQNVSGFRDIETFQAYLHGLTSEEVLDLLGFIANIPDHKPE